MIFKIKKSSKTGLTVKTNNNIATTTKVFKAKNLKSLIFLFLGLSYNVEDIIIKKNSNSITEMYI